MREKSEKTTIDFFVFYVYSLKLDNYQLNCSDLFVNTGITSMLFDREFCFQIYVNFVFIDKLKVSVLVPKNIEKTAKF